jgi:hypothetical protein
MIRIFTALAVLVGSALLLATIHAQGAVATITFLAEIQSVTTGGDHEVTKIKITSLDKKYAYVKDFDGILAAKAKFIFLDDGVKKDFSAKTVMSDAAAKKALQKGKVVQIRLGGTQKNAVVGASGIQEVKCGPSIESKAKKD